MRREAGSAFVRRLRMLVLHVSYPVASPATHTSKYFLIWQGQCSPSDDRKYDLSADQRLASFSTAE
jgi:hypothetical protein